MISDFVNQPPRFSTSVIGLPAARWLIFLLAAASACMPLSAKQEYLPGAFIEFNQWWKQYVDAEDAERPGLVAAGKKIAEKRRNEMLQLMASNPEQAIQLAFDEEYHSALPPEIAALVEIHARGLGKLVVEKKGEATQRTVILDDLSLQAYFYGPRAKLTSREEILIHGVVLEGRIAVDGSPLERFPNRETLIDVLSQSEGKKTCPICHEPGTIPAAVGDTLLWFDSDEHLVVCEKALIEKENSPE